MTNKPKWTKRFFADLAERVAWTFLQSLSGTSLLMGVTKLDWHDRGAVFATLGAPTLLSLVKGLLANMANGESGASSLPSPPGPEIDHEDAEDAAEEYDDEEPLADWERELGYDEQPVGRHRRGAAEQDVPVDPEVHRLT